jgi:transcriptional regulator NrdR family protein
MLSGEKLANIPCPHCGEPTSEVVDTRGKTIASTIRRRRQCCACNQRFTTIEVLMSEWDSVVLKNQLADEVRARVRDLLLT